VLPFCCFRSRLCAHVSHSAGPFLLLCRVCVWPRLCATVSNGDGPLSLCVCVSSCHFFLSCFHNTVPWGLWISIIQNNFETFSLPQCGAVKLVKFGTSLSQLRWTFAALNLIYLVIWVSLSLFTLFFRTRLKLYILDKRNSVLCTRLYKWEPHHPLSPACIL
jgi:uncharacterized integral membrane protein